MSFSKGFKKTAQTINERIGNPFGRVAPKPPAPPPPAPRNVAASGQSLGQRIGFPGA